MVLTRRFLFPGNVQREVYEKQTGQSWAIRHFEMHRGATIKRRVSLCHGPWLYHGRSKDHWAGCQQPHHWAPHSEAWPKFPSLFRKSSTLCGMWHGSDLLRIHPNRIFRIVFDFKLFQKVAFGGIFWKKNRGIDTMRSLCHKATCWVRSPASQLGSVCGLLPPRGAPVSGSMGCWKHWVSGGSQVFIRTILIWFSMLLEFKLQDDCINQDILNDSVSKSEPFTKPGRAKGCDSGWIKPRSLSSLSTPKPFTPAAFPLGVSLVWCLPSLSNLQSYIWNYLKPSKTYYAQLWISIHSY